MTKFITHYDTPLMLVGTVIHEPDFLQINYFGQDGLVIVDVGAVKRSNTMVDCCEHLCVISAIVASSGIPSDSSGRASIFSDRTTFRTHFAI